MEVLGGDIKKEPLWKYLLGTLRRNLCGSIRWGHYEGTYVEVLGGDITKEPMWKY